jgi:flagellar FliL protein
MLVGAELMFILMHGEVAAQMVKKPSGGRKVDGPAPGEKASQGKISAEKVTYGFMFPLDPFIVNLAGNGGNRILKVNISLKMSAPEVHLELKKNILKLTDSILFLLSSKSFENIDSYQDKAKLENEIMIRINKFLTSGQVNGAYFTEFIIQ